MLPATRDLRISSLDMLRRSWPRLRWIAGGAAEWPVVSPNRSDSIGRRSGAAMWRDAPVGDLEEPDMPLPVGRSEVLARTIARSRQIVEQSRWLCEQAHALWLQSARLCPVPVVGASDAFDPQSLDGGPAANPAVPRPAELETRRSVVVLAHETIMRALIADTLRDVHEVSEAADLSTALKVLASGARVDAIVADCGMFDEGWALDACVSLTRELYEHCPWIPVILIGDTPPPALKAALLLTAARAFIPRDFTLADVAAAVARVGRRPDAAIPNGERVDAIKRTFVVLETAITDVPPLSALASMASMSRSHFSRTFHAVAGISLRDYVRDLRLKRAHELMQVSGLSLTAIATASGFYDLPHFNKAFRHRFGMSPTQFRLASVRA